MKKRLSVMALLMAPTLSMLTACSLHYGRTPSGTDSPQPSESDTNEGFSDENITADEFYRKNSEEVIAVEDAQTYEAVLTGAEVANLMTERGFTEYPITYDMDITGEYAGENEVTEDSDEKSPMYTTFYMTESGDVWVIYNIGGAMAASPLSYNLGSDDAELLLSETDRLISYDNTENKFYITVPKESTVRMEVVDEINAELLETYSEEGLE